MSEKAPNGILIFDGHLDLAMNAMEWNRDLTWSTDEIRESEKKMTDKPDRGQGTVSFSALRSGNIRLCMATQIARYVKKTNPLPGWRSPQQAWAMTQAQLAWYRAMEEAGQLQAVTDATSLQGHLERLDDPGYHAVGYILSLEGADSIVHPDYLEKAHANGLRAVGPAHYGPGTYAFGTDSDGGIGEKGKVLLRKMEDLNIILDATHLCDRSFWEAMDHFRGRVWASHNNCRALVPHNRQFSDEQIRELINREAVIGAALDAWMLAPNWVRGVSTPEGAGVTLETVADHIDHICQLAGNSRHAAIGSDLDGAFGKNQSPMDIDTIADLQKLIPVLWNRGYTAEDIGNILHKNWIRFLMETWKKSSPILVKA